jgi:hypothetical protein
LESFHIFFELIDNFLCLFSLNIDEGSDLLFDGKANLIETLLVFLQILAFLNFFSFGLVKFLKVSEGLVDHVQGQVDIIFPLVDGKEVLLDVEQLVDILLPVVHFFDENVGFGL